MKILHTEASPGWGGQELRILHESEGMRQRGHEVIFAIQKGGGLVQPARDKGFTVYEISFRKREAFHIAFQLIRIIRKHKIQIVNTHSSLDAWIGGFIGKLCQCLRIRTRHLSTPIRTGLKCRILYNYLADCVVTTCEETAKTLRGQAKLTKNRCLSIPTGVNPDLIQCDPANVLKFRERLGVKPDDCLVGTLCVLRGWKGISDLLSAAKELEKTPNLKWVVVGSGASEQYFREERKRLGLEKNVIFTGHLYPPFTALAAMDIFLLLSWGHEGVSQASLQAAWFQKPLITTSVGGLPEVCQEGKTGILVPKNDPQAVAKAVIRLAKNKTLREQMGRKAKALVLKKFTLAHTLDKMEAIYNLRKS